MACLSRIDANLLQYYDKTKPANTVDLYINDSGNNIKMRDGEGPITTPVSQSCGSEYSNCLLLSNSEYICYHLSSRSTLLTFYPLSDAYNGKTVNVHLPNASMNQRHTLTIQEVEQQLLVNLILTDGSLLTLQLPLSFMFSFDDTLSKEWFHIQNPYDFTVRVPHFLYFVSPKLSVVFLEDGGLLGLKRIDDLHYEPLLFNDNSYLKSLTRLFSKNSSSYYDGVISCKLFHEKYLIVLTQNCHLKIWDLTSFTLIQDYDIVSQPHLNPNHFRKVEVVGEYLSLYNNTLVTLLPLENGLFQMGSLLVDSNGVLTYTFQNNIPTNLSASAIWSIVDLVLTRPLELNVESSYLNLIVLWKSGTASKLQILNVKDESFKSYEWIESINKSLVDLQSEHDLDIVTKTGDIERGLSNLKSRYGAQIFERAQQILSENKIVMAHNEDEDYLANLETILRDVKTAFNEASSITLYGDEIILINCFQPYNHFLYKLNTTVENWFYNMHSDVEDSELFKYLKTLNGFASTISNDVLRSISNKFLDIMTGELPDSMTIPEKFTDIFKSCLENQFEITNLKILFDELNSFDIMVVLNDLIDNQIKPGIFAKKDFISSIKFDAFTSIISTESLHQLLSIHHRVTLQVLLTFILLDFDTSVFGQHLSTLLDLHYKQSLLLHLYRQDKFLLTNVLLKDSSEYSQGVKFFNYGQLISYIDFLIYNVYSVSNTENPFFLTFFQSCIIENSSHKNTRFFLENVERPFYLRHNVVQEFMFAMTLFSCGKFDQSYEIFQLHDYPEAINDLLPIFLEDLKSENYHGTSIWKDLLRTFAVPYRHSAFYYQLSILFDRNNSQKFALKCISKSAEYSLKEIQIEEPQEFKERQHVHYLNLLIHFRMFEEVLDILRLGHEYLSDMIRTKFFQLLLEKDVYSQDFFSTLLRLCNSQSDNEGLYLRTVDIKIVDSILSRNLKSSHWECFKKVYCFRMLNKSERSAAEVLYQYILTCSNLNFIGKKKCYLMVINVLSCFHSTYDQWILNGSRVVTLTDLRDELRNL
ncbi:nup120p [Saccharomyces arboricola H-6]|uniref:Nup120p n=1 Tax=Saccharomyces arboricola (strain H-6 / AS 2.3317 / CBS 10644) TaxID=1160507 RepID=J8LLD2_SACAR|nr:nup120p [Saccharomyces arboricola H-6]